MAPRESDSSTGFRTFWEAEQKKAASQNLTFIQFEVEPARGSKKGRLRQVSNASKASAKSADSPSAESNSSLSRRQQVYLAQKRHRTRKAEYAQSLEAQITKLRQQYARVKSEGHSTASENAEIGHYLISAGVLTAADLAPPPSSILDPNIDLGDNLAFDEGSPQPSRGSAASSCSDSEETTASSKHKSYVLLDQLGWDPESRERIRQCSDLLLRDVEPFERDEAEDKKTWDALADLVLDER